MVEHRELIERLTKLDGPSREVDAELWALPGLPPDWSIADAGLARRKGVAALLDQKQTAIGGASWRFPICGADGADWCFGVRQFTASLDAAVALGERMLPGQVWHLMTAALKAWSIKDGKPADLARFYCIALLRALEGGNDG